MFLVFTHRKLLNQQQLLELDGVSFDIICKCSSTASTNAEKAYGWAMIHGDVTIPLQVLDHAEILLKCSRPLGSLLPEYRSLSRQKETTFTSALSVPTQEHKRKIDQNMIAKTRSLFYDLHYRGKNRREQFFYLEVTKRRLNTDLSSELSELSEHFVS